MLEYIIQILVAGGAFYIAYIIWKKKIRDPEMIFLAGAFSGFGFVQFVQGFCFWIAFLIKNIF